MQRRFCFPRVVCTQRWYLCGRVFVKRACFSSLLCICIVDMEMDDIGDMVGGTTLGDAVG